MVQQATKVAAVGWVEELGETHKKLNKGPDKYFIANVVDLQTYSLK